MAAIFHQSESTCISREGKKAAKEDQGQTKETKNSNSLTCVYWNRWQQLKEALGSTNHMHSFVILNFLIIVSLILKWMNFSLEAIFVLFL